ncbi:MAG: general secretion pathway protein D [Limisphaerales bacterium]|jgi:general secretion pathway protein D
MIEPQRIAMNRIKGTNLLIVIAIAALLLPSNLLAQRGGFGGGGGGGRTGGTGTSSTRTYPGNGQIGGAIVMPDPETRRLIVITDDETAAYISQVVTNLDTPKPQVLIKVVFVEVTHSKGSDIGTTINQLRAEPSNSSAESTIATALGTAGTLSTGGTWSLIAGDFSSTIRAIAENGKTEILSRPSILTRNNQEAVITIGQEVPFVTNSQINQQGNTINTVTYEDVGIILRVTPYITQGDLVEMIVAPEISSISSTLVTINQGVQLQAIDKRAAETVVVTKHGTTVMIGGLMQTRKVETRRKIPILGDIPLLGFAFRRKEMENVKTELLIFLTPYVIQQPSQVADIVRDEAARSELTNGQFDEKDVKKYFEGVPITPKPAPEKRRRLPFTIPIDY